MADELVHNPGHYTGFTNNAQLINIKENLYPNMADTVKYAARAGWVDQSRAKGKQKQDHEKALWYLLREYWRLYGYEELSKELTNLNKDISQWEREAQAMRSINQSK